MTSVVINPSTRLIGNTHLCPWYYVSSVLASAKYPGIDFYAGLFFVKNNHVSRLILSCGLNPPHLRGETTSGPRQIDEGKDPGPLLRHSIRQIHPPTGMKLIQGRISVAELNNTNVPLISPTLYAVHSLSCSHRRQASATYKYA